MRIIPASFSIESEIDGDKILKWLELCARNCYKSEDGVDDDKTEVFLKKRILDTGHHAMLEHHMISVRFIVDRGVTHEIVRHRLASYAQESTRYCNYSKLKFDQQITVVDIRPYCKTGKGREIWMDLQQASEKAYFAMLEAGEKPQIARSCLTNSLKAEIIMSANVREWMHFFKMRASKYAHPQMREVACPLLREFRTKIPVIYDEVGDPDCEVAV